jgi:hypothetical protein
VDDRRRDCHHAYAEADCELPLYISVTVSPTTMDPRSGLHTSDEWREFMVGLADLAFEMYMRGEISVTVDDDPDTDG